MDMQIKNRPEIWVNDKFLMKADTVTIKYGEKLKNPDKASGMLGIVMNITKNSIPEKEEKRKAEREANSTKEYDAFFKKMVAKIGDTDFHQPLN